MLGGMSDIFGNLLLRSFAVSPKKYLMVRLSVFNSTRQEAVHVIAAGADRDICILGIACRLLLSISDFSSLWLFWLSFDEIMIFNNGLLYLIWQWKRERSSAALFVSWSSWRPSRFVCLLEVCLRNTRFAFNLATIWHFLLQMQLNFIFFILLAFPSVTFSRHLEMLMRTDGKCVGMTELNFVSCFFTFRHLKVSRKERRLMLFMSHLSWAFNMETNIISDVKRSSVSPGFTKLN